jgi:hypothetical protein
MPYFEPSQPMPLSFMPPKGNPLGKAALRGGAGQCWVGASVQATVLAPVLETVRWRELR